MRCALISIIGQPRDGGDRVPLAVAGKTLARRQLDFALAAGCESIIVIGDGAAPEAIGLRHEAEAAGARFVAIRDSHGLLGAVRAADQLLVLVPGLLPETNAALAALGKGNALLVLAAGPGVAAGFERIDLERAWAGAMVLPGAKVERLAELPADSDPASALLRIALQAGIAERHLPEEVLVEGSWAMIRENETPGFADRQWLKRHLPAHPPRAPSRWLAYLALAPVALRLLAIRRAPLSLAGAAGLLLAGALGAASLELPALAFVLLALAVVLGELAMALAALRDVPFAHARTTRGLALALSLGIDLSLAGCGVLAIEGNWLHRLFPPLVLVGALHSRPAAGDAAVRDRGALAAVFALAASLDLLEPAIMLVGLALIAWDAAQSRITRA